MKKVLFCGITNIDVLNFYLPHLKYFKEKGYEINVISNIEKNISFCDRKLLNPKNLSSKYKLRQILKKEKFDIIHCYDSKDSIATIRLSKRSRKKGTRIIYTIPNLKSNNSKLVKYVDDLIILNKKDYNLVKTKFNTTVHYVSKLKENLFDEFKNIYEPKKIIYLRSTSIINDSRATKEINTYSKNNNKVIVLGWNRQQLEINDCNKNIFYDFYNKKSEYGKGIKNLFSLSLFQFWLYQKLKKYKNKYDIIHACDFDTAFIASLISKKYNKEFIYDIYDYYIDCHNLSFLTSFIEKLDIKTINKADVVIICTEQRKKQISKCNPKKVCVVHNSPKISQKNSEREFNPNKVKICYVGILQDDRLLIEISKEIVKNKNIEFHIGGFGKYEEYFINLSKANKNIKFHGQMKYDDVLELESTCDILFATYNPKVPNHKYSAPNKVYEAMALGKPIIVCKNTGVDELVEREKIGFTIDYDAKEFIKIIKQIDAKKYDLINKKGIQLYNEKYSWDTMEREILKNIE